MSASHPTSTHEKVVDTVKSFATSIMVDVGMEALRDRAKEKIQHFAEKGVPEHRVEMFYAILVQFAEKVPDGERKRKTILRRWSMRQLRQPRNYGPGRHHHGVPYEPLSEYHMIEIYLNNKRYLQEKNLEEDYFRWLDEMASMTDEDHDLVLEAYEDDKWDRVFEQIDEDLEPVNDFLDGVPGSDSPEVFGGRFAHAGWKVTFMAVIAVVILIFLSI